MGEMDLIYLVVGVGLGLLGSRFTGSIKEPVVSTTPEPQPEPVVSTTPEPQPEPVVSTTPEPQPEPVVSTTPEPQEADQEDLQPLREKLKQTQLAYEMAKEMSQFKAGFLARTSHELRSPLSSLIGMHQLILSDLCDSPEEAREFVAQANASALKMVKVLDEVIAVAKTEHGTNQLEIQPLRLTKVFDELYRLTHMQAANRNLRFELVAPDPEIHVLADSRRFQQVLVGLVSIAIAQMESGSIQLSAGCSPESEEVHIWIDIECPTRLWSEPVDLLSKTPDVEMQPGQTAEFSPGITY
jgi:signal transduction histidine kinase